MTDGITIGIVEGAFNSWLEGQRLTIVELLKLPPGTLANAGDVRCDFALPGKPP